MQQKPHPKARPASAPGKGSRWQPNVASVRLSDGTIVRAWVYDTDAGGAPPGRFEWAGSWWSVPFSELL